MYTKIFAALSVIATFFALYFGIKTSTFNKKIVLLNDEISTQLKELDYLKQLNLGDSLLLIGKFEDASEVFEKIDSIHPELKLFDKKMKHVEFLQAGLDSLEYLRAVAERISKENEAKNLLLANSAQKDSLLDQYNSEIYDLSIEVFEAKKELEEKENQLETTAKFGKLEFTNSKGTKVIYVGEVDKNKANGEGYGLFETGGIYSGYWKDNKRNGVGKYTWKDGSSYVGEFVNDVRQGTGTYTFTSGEVYKGDWQNNKRWGKGTMYQKDGTVIISSNWENDVVLRKKK